ncbi:c-type cytochrome [Gaetbulibacter saemankumensis]|uniref:c-type cytochrome n=1 Tax=Gaetbulibacter saemankumensis TaxID=311208 RepID=UPI00040BF169|nr:c-type cytochrome [Gaetbulibacter saemankumensis]
MKTNFSFLMLACLFFYACISNQKKTDTTVDKPEVKEEPTINLVERGEYLVDLGGCHHCHSPKIMTEQGPIPDPKRLLSGHPADEVLAPFDKETAKHYMLFTPGLTSFTGPWGTSFAANLTPDATGIGTWTEEQFFKSLREGKHKGLEGSRMVLPPMPWQDFAKLTDEDIKSIFAYLKTQKPIENVVSAPLPPIMQE